ncbi:MAG: glycoside hydrolase family 15 protein [Myxococcota bacterium]|nr:glycoside hydrolase family 15 protein [Myxococcota bacterium]
MDLYSAASRLARPFVFREDDRDPAVLAKQLGIGGRGIIGDGLTCALVRVDGAIDWCCMPRFDSPSCFGALLDPDRGGITWIQPVHRPFETLQQYDPDTNVLETLFRVAGRGVIRLTDYMPWTDDPRAAIHEIHRRVECVEGEVEVEIVFDPRFDYGQGETTLEHGEHGVIARGPSGDRMVAVVAGGRWESRPAGGLLTRSVLKKGERRWMVLSYAGLSPEPIESYRPFEHLRATRRAWREWSRQITYDGPWRHHVMRSALLMKLLTYAPTGAMVAAPTTSLPEWLGNTRNWDYRYVWARDAAMAVRALSLIGCEKEAREFFYFVRDCLERDDGLRVMYAIDGLDVPEERILEHLRGFGDSRPVRVGNGARHQLQLDAAGSLVDAAYMFERGGGSLTLRTWRHLRGVIETVRQRWHEPDHGIWEPRSGEKHNLDSKMMCWVALERGARIARLFGDAALDASWSATARAVSDEILRSGLDPSGKRLTAAFGVDTPDSALLRIPLHHFLEANHPLVVQTTAWLRNELGSGPFLYRYRLDTDDGVGGHEGAFVLCGFWLAETYAMQGRIEEAHETFVAHAEASNHVGLLAEEIDPATGALLGNFPQSFSHLGMINAALRIDLAMRLRDEGSHAVPTLIPL